MRNSEIDITLVRAAQGGDKEAFAVLLGRHRPLLVALCRRALADPVLSEDAAQEAALTAFLNLDRLRSADRFGPWLGGIGLNVCRRLLRERARDGWSWEAVQGGRRERELADPEPGPEAVADAAELAVRTREAIAVLPPGQRSAVVLFYLSGLTHAETADLLGINVGAVKTRLHKARQTLKQQLSDTERDEAMDERLTRRTLAKTAAALTGSAAVGHATAGQAGAKGVAKVTDGQEAMALVEVRVADVRRKQAANGYPRPHIVVLEEIGGTRRLPIWVGEAEGTATAMQLEQVEIPRPPTITFTASLLQAAGGQLREVRIDRLVDTVFYATAVVEGREGTGTIDARPSDAINLALLTGAPIRVEPAIFETESTDTGMSVASTEGPSEIVAEVMAS
jgi:RNA polymerase sigma factor (sigma-70 family)